MTEFRSGEFAIDDIKTSVRFACFTKYQYYDVVLQIGSRIHIRLSDGKEIKGILDAIIADTDAGLLTLSIDSDDGYYQDILPDDIETIFPHDCDNCTGPTEEKAESNISRIRITTDTGWECTSDLAIPRESIRKIEVL